MQNIIRFIRKNRYESVYLTGVMLFAAGLPLSKTAMSIALFLLSIHWLISKGYLSFPGIRSERGLAFLFFMLIIIVHLTGLVFTSDFRFALKDLRIKLPLLLFPLFMVTAPTLTAVQVKYVIKVFLISVLAGSLIALYNQLVHQPVDARDITPFVSHIRFSMMVCLAAVASAWLAITGSDKWPVRLILALCAVWFSISLIMLESLTGLLAFAMVVAMVLITGAFLKGKPLIRSGSIIILVMVAVSIYWITQAVIIKEFLPDRDLQARNLEKFTSLGNPYYHDITSPVNENGNLVWINVSFDEMCSAWNSRSRVEHDSILPSGGRVADVLIRYLSSKGLKKDAEGVNSLTEDDISAIERGITNFRHDQWSGMRRKFDQLKWEYWNYRQGGDARGHSLMQRIELWQTGISLAKENLITGVGTGDLKNEFAGQLEKQGSSLTGTPLRTHNQYITILITFGLPGLLLFLLAIVMPLIIRRKTIDIVFAAFLVIVLSSMFVEDTLETQVGVSFFVFFFSLYIFQDTSAANTSESNV